MGLSNLTLAAVALPTSIPLAVPVGRLLLNVVPVSLQTAAILI